MSRSRGEFIGRSSSLSSLYTFLSTWFDHSTGLARYYPPTLTVWAFTEFTGFNERNLHYAQITDRA